MHQLLQENSHSLSRSQGYILTFEKEKIYLNSLISLNSQKWQIKSKATWTERGEKLTKYFYSRYMKRISSSPTAHIQILNCSDNPSSQQKLDYAVLWFE